MSGGLDPALHLTHDVEGRKERREQGGKEREGKERRRTQEITKQINE